MKIITVIFILLFSSTSWSFNHNVVMGQWAVYENGSYYFLNINNDFSGTMVRAFNDAPSTFNFGSNDVIKRDGYLEINLTANEKAVLSAWRLKSGPGRLTGQVYMYKDNGEVFNMLYFPLQFLEPNHEFLSHEAIKNLSDKYR